MAAASPAETASAAAARTRLPQHLGADVDDDPRFLGRFQEPSRRQQPPGGVPPAHQRLHSLRNLGRQIDDGLKHDFELVGGDRLAKVDLQDPALLGLPGEVIGVELPAPPSPFLGDGHRSVGIPQQRESILDRGLGGRRRDDPDRHRYVSLLAF